MTYDRLFSPLKIGKLELKNRILMPAIHLMYNMDGYANERFNAFYWRRAEGGAALIVVGGCRFDEYGGSPGMMSLQDDSFIPGYQEFTEGMHARGAKVGVQLYHAGAYAHSIANDGREALAPSAVFSRFTKEMPREITQNEIKTVIEKWAAAAARAKEAGFDLVEISASAGYLISQFLSPKTNLRTDEYGGSWENRTRFPLEVVAAVRKAVGEDFPICFRIAGSDLVPGSNTNEDAVAFAKLLEASGVDFINVTGGWHESVIPQLTGDLPRGGFSYLAAAVRDAVRIPVAASNRINDPGLAEKILALGEADMVSIGRPLIADPNWPKKAEGGESRLIRHCVSCNQGCLAKTFFAQPVECLVNVEAGLEFEAVQHAPAEMPKNILVVGAGPAGCEFAIRAAQRGHRVTIWEKSSRIGGQVLWAAAPHAKREFLAYVSYLQNILQMLGVTLVLNMDASVEAVQAAGFDTVITATGSSPSTLRLPGKDTIPVYSAHDIFEGKAIAGRNVVIVGGGAVGCECADFLAYEAAHSPEEIYFMLTQGSEPTEKILELANKSRRNISIVDTAKIGSGFEPGTAWPLMKELTRYGVRQYPYAQILEVTDNSVELTYVQQKTREQKARERETGIREPEQVLELSIPCDTIVIGSGSLSNDALFRALTPICKELYNIGDSDTVGNILAATKAAAALAAKI